MTDFIGTTGDDLIHGTHAAESFDVSQGGDDTVRASGHDDVVYIGGALTAADQLDGGKGGNDILQLDGDYGAQLVLGAKTMVGFEAIQLFAGHDYNLKVNDANLAGIFTVGADRLHAGDHLVFNDAADTDASLFVLLGPADVTVKGGAGLDWFVADADMSAADRIDGGDGDRDLLVLNGGGTYDLGPKAIRNLENIRTASNSYDITLADKALAVGHTLFVDGIAALTMHFDGSAETGGDYSIRGGGGDDVLMGGAGDDVINALVGGADRITGNGGADTLEVNGGDTIVYRSLADSRHAAPDLIVITTGDNTIDLSTIDADTGQAGDQAFALVSALDGHAGEIALSYDAGTDRTTLVADVDGDGHADMTVLFTGDHHDFDGFVF